MAARPPLKSPSAASTAARAETMPMLAMWCGCIGVGARIRSTRIRGEGVSIAITLRTALA